MIKKLVSVFIGLSMAGCAMAQTNSERDYDRALAAGYKAQFTCSGLWNGNKSAEYISADELTGIYPKIANIVPTLDVNVDQTERQVRVKYSNDMPPRIAIWNRTSGCTAMPIGFGGLKTGTPIKERTFLDDRPWPMGDRIPSVRASKEVVQARQVASDAFDGKSFGTNSKTSAVLIIKDRQIIAEQYKMGHDLHTAQRTWSVAKSMAGTIIGHSVHQGMVDVTSRVQIPQWKKFGDPRAFLTIDNLLRMSSGLTSDTAGNRTDAIYMGGASVSQRATAWPLLHRPGTKFRYANNDTLIAVLAVQAAHEDQKNKLGNYMPQIHDFDPYRFFRKLGMTRTFVETDWQDNYILSSQVWTTARDLARMSMLYLNNGTWDGERLLPENWREYVSTPSGPQPTGRNFGYGAQFWLMNQSDGIPNDTFAAFGNRGQYLVIIPSMEVAIVRRGYDTRDTRFDIEAFTRAVVAAVGK
ncbi:MAG: serine hydrolase [Parasphingorhabdus sp.]